MHAPCRDLGVDDVTCSHLHPRHSACAGMPQCTANASVTVQHSTHSMLNRHSMQSAAQRAAQPRTCSSHGTAFSSRETQACPPPATAGVDSAGWLGGCATGVAGKSSCTPRVGVPFAAEPSAAAFAAVATAPRTLAHGDVPGGRWRPSVAARAGASSSQPRRGDPPPAGACWWPWLRSAHHII